MRQLSFTALGTSGSGRSHQLILITALIPPRAGKLSFWQWHNSLILLRRRWATQTRQSFPSGVSRLRQTSARPVIKIGPALFTQPFAILMSERLQGNGHNQGISDRFSKVHSFVFTKVYIRLIRTDLHFVATFFPGRWFGKKRESRLDFK